MAEWTARIIIFIISFLSLTLGLDMHPALSAVIAAVLAIFGWMLIVIVFDD